MTLAKSKERGEMEFVATQFEWLPRDVIEIVARRLGVLGKQSVAAPAPLTQTAPNTETISQAAEAWFTEKQRDSSTAAKRTTIEGHRQRVGVVVKRCDDLPLPAVTRARASDFLAKIVKTNQTFNNYV